MRQRLRPLVSAAIAASLVVGSATVLVRAAGLTARFDAEVRRLRAEWRAEQDAAGLPERTKRKELYTQYAHPGDHPLQGHDGRARRVGPVEPLGEVPRRRPPS